MAAVTSTAAAMSRFIRCSNCGKCCSKDDMARPGQGPRPAGAPAVRPGQPR